ncbi:MAG TPA: tetratricopeptide repeat protein, partial [Telluria sp.]|nr:tetratricopeptide repeat protein [Telluria sp.]
AAPTPSRPAAAQSKPREARVEKAAATRLRAETLAKLKAENTATKARPAVEGKEETGVQKAEAAYRKALASLQDGWVSDAITSLEQSLQANPKHEAARQTLVSLLMENKRYDEAMRQLQAGLSADPRQPALAMLLARLQIERGGSGIETLTRTLPYASGNGEYHAFLAGALQRQGRNSEAASQYQAALRSAPQNGVWWMGLGIALQGDKRDGEALEAFRRAKANGLSPELQSFVDRKIQQLAR